MPPLVSVRIVTYNHEAYIRQCLEGVLMQRTNFDYEVIVGEHSSSDGTQKIVLDYQKNYPDPLQVLITSREQGLMENVLRTQRACQGKYHALCEGDDYWIDPLKLQKQVDLLEAHPEMSMCFHNAFVVREDIFHIHYYFDVALKNVLNFEDIYLRAIPTGSIVGRSEILNSLPAWRTRVMHADRLIRMWCAHAGPLGYLDDAMSVYRKHPHGLTSKLGQSYHDYYTNTLFLCEEFNKATDYQHAALMKNLLAWAKTYRQRARWGRWYYVLFPWRSLGRMQKKWRAMRRT